MLEHKKPYAFLFTGKFREYLLPKGVKRLPRVTTSRKIMAGE